MHRVRRDYRSDAKDHKVDYPWPSHNFANAETAKQQNNSMNSGVFYPFQPHLARDTTKEPASKDRVGYVQRENSHGNLRRQKKYLFIDFLNSPSSQQLPRRRQNSLRGSWNKIGLLVKMNETDALFHLYHLPLEECGWQQRLWPGCFPPLMEKCQPMSRHQCSSIFFIFFNFSKFASAQSDSI